MDPATRTWWPTPTWTERRGRADGGGAHLLRDADQQARQQVGRVRVLRAPSSTDSATGRSVIVTAAHCVFDDVSKTFARSVLFIPGQDDRWQRHDRPGLQQRPARAAGRRSSASSTATGPRPSSPTTRRGTTPTTWCPTAAAHVDRGGRRGTATALDAAVGALPVSLRRRPRSGTSTYGPGVLVRRRTRTSCTARRRWARTGTVNWWLPQLRACPVARRADRGSSRWTPALASGPIISVNSWGYTNQPGMAGPKLSGTSAECLFARGDVARPRRRRQDRGVVPGAADPPRHDDDGPSRCGGPSSSGLRPRRPRRRRRRRGRGGGRVPPGRWP